VNRGRKHETAAARGRRLLVPVLAFALGALASGAIALAVDSPPLQQTSRSGGTPLMSVRPTGVGMPLVGAHGTVGAGDYATSLKNYHASGRYRQDLEAVADQARSYLGKRVKKLRKRAARRCRRAKRLDFPPARRRKACRPPKPMALVLDIDETSLSNYQYLALTNFTQTVASLALSVVAADAPPVRPTLDLYRYAQSKNVDVFFITGRPDNIPGTRQQTELNLRGAGYRDWDGLALNPGGLGTVEYKSGERKRIEDEGYRIIANVGDQESDLQGGHADRAFKLPNPFYFIGP
jgi:hypothetical protein